MIARIFATSLGAALLLAGLSAQAHEYKVGQLHIGHPYARPTPPAAKTGAAYLSVSNKGKATDRLLRASSPASASVELHTMSMEGNIMRMRPVKAIEVPAGGSVEFKPGGLHLMLQDLKQPLKGGDRIPLTLVFEKAGSVRVELAVEDAAPAAKDGAHAGH